MSRAASPSAGRPYGLARVCGLWGVPRSTVYHQRRRALAPRGPRRRGPLGPCADAELAARIREVLEASPFHGEGYRKVWARLRWGGIRTSKERVRRLMREHGLQAPRRVGQSRGPRAHDGTVVTDTPGLMWGTDMTAAVTLREGLVNVFVCVDHFASECVGLHAAKSGSRFEALEPVHQGVREHFGSIEEGAASGLKVRHDHGSAYMSDGFQGQLAWLGIESSPSFVRAPEGNGVAERFIRTLKENLLWVRTFETVEELRLALLEFKRTYNENWLIERHGWRTPAQVRAEKPGLLEQAA